MISSKKLYCLAQFYDEQQKYEEAEPLYRRAFQHSYEEQNAVLPREKLDNVINTW